GRHKRGFERISRLYMDQSAQGWRGKTAGIQVLPGRIQQARYHNRTEGEGSDIPDSLARKHEHNQEHSQPFQERYGQTGLNISVTGRVPEQNRGRGSIYTRRADHRTTRLN